MNCLPYLASYVNPSVTLQMGNVRPNGSRKTSLRLPASCKVFSSRGERAPERGREMIF